MTNSEIERHENHQEISSSSNIDNDSTGNIQTKNLCPDSTEPEGVEIIPIESTYDIDLINDDSDKNTTPKAVQTSHTKVDVESTEKINSRF